MPDTESRRKDGIVYDLPFETYLEEDRASKSGLLVLAERSPAHARIEKEQSNAMLTGSAVHCAILEPDTFEARFARGPEDRRGNKWKEFVELVGPEGALTSGDFDAALEIRDALFKDAKIKAITGAGCRREVSAFFTDPITGLACRCRPDSVTPSGLMVELKTTTDARAPIFARRVKQLGYHSGEAFYVDGYKLAGGDVAGLVFLVAETKPPYAFKLYELTADAVAEGRAMMRRALDSWAQCKASGIWPGYSTDVEPLDLKKWDYVETQPLGS